ncbi:hypothetical protein F0U60_42790 [Archangium minus]|uniref:Bacterial type II secretion system protein E domain-containing protein n=1 Tax=Archangium minus TaxID=83450 RepID=A0ABY9X3Y8_9BACT|nr:hypothetical protein F0U60_42790 [Archangium minus]
MNIRGFHPWRGAGLPLGRHQTPGAGWSDERKGEVCSGKTTLLNIVSSLIPGEERILTIEDSAEFHLNQSHLAPFDSRPPDRFVEAGVNMARPAHRRGAQLLGSRQRPSSTAPLQPAVPRRASIPSVRQIGQSS